MWFLSIELFWVPDIKICAHICICREYWYYLKSKQMIYFVGAETPLTKSELNQMHIQISIHNCSSHRTYLLSSWPSVKYVTEDMRTYPNPCCFENIFQTFIYSKISLFFFFPHYCASVYIFMLVSNTEVPLLSVRILQVLSLQSRVLHCRKGIKPQKGDFYPKRMIYCCLLAKWQENTTVRILVTCIFIIHEETGDAVLPT